MLLFFVLLFTWTRPLPCQEYPYSVIELQRVNDKLSINIEENNMSFSEKEALIKAAHNYSDYILLY